MTCTSRRFGRTARPTAHRRGYGRSRSATPSSSGRTTGGNRAGTRRRQKRGRIIAAGKTREVIFEAVDGPINDRIDEAYRAKYRGSPYLSPMIGGGPGSV